MDSIRKKHDDFIREIRTPLKSDGETIDIPSKTDDTRLSDIELQKELERKFDELFGTLDDDDE